MMHSMDDDSQVRTDLSHLPEDKQRELEEIVALLRAVTEVEMIVLFGSYARGDWKEDKDLAPKRWSGHASDYDLLVIVADPAVADTPHIRKAFRDVCKAQGFSAQVNPRSSTTSRTSTPTSPKAATSSSTSSARGGCCTTPAASSWPSRTN